MVEPMEPVESGRTIHVCIDDNGPNWNSQTYKPAILRIVDFFAPDGQFGCSSIEMKST
jgi:hypothetical protein